MASAKGARTAAVWGSGVLEDNKNQVLGELSTGYDKGQGFLNQAGDLYKGMTARGQPGLDKYDALTLGDGASIQRALEGSGGYQFNMDQGLQALQRARSAGGMLASGNTDTDAMTFASGLASNTLNQERQALNPYLQMYQQGTQGQAGTLGSLAGLTTDYYGNRGSTIDNTNKSIVELGSSALKAGAAAKSANQAMMLGAVTGGINLLGGLAGGGAGGFTKMLSGFGGGGGSRMSSGTGGLY